jgi:hypothetical protein
MANFSVSPRIQIGGQSFSPQHGINLSPVENSDLEATPPNPNGDQPSEAMYAYQNHDKDFNFQKITPPMYGPNDSIARHTGIPANEPDFIADFHFIGIMRAVDDMLRHRYSGYIGGSYDTPGTT